MNVTKACRIPARRRVVSEAYGYGSFSDYAVSVNFGSSVCLSSGAGQGQIVWNNAAAAWNNSYNYVTVFYNSGWDCSIACQDIGSLLKVDLSFALKNENASILIY